MEKCFLSWIEKRKVWCLLCMKLVADSLETLTLVSLCLIVWIAQQTRKELWGRVFLFFQPTFVSSKKRSRGKEWYHVKTFAAVKILQENLKNWLIFEKKLAWFFQSIFLGFLVSFCFLLFGWFLWLLNQFSCIQIRKTENQRNWKRQIYTATEAPCLFNR